MQSELSFHLRAVTRLLYVVTDEEDLFLRQLQEASRIDIKVWNPALGLHPLSAVVNDWSVKNHPVDKDTVNIHDALIAIYKEAPPQGQRRVYVICDPERWLAEPHVQRRVLNILHQTINNEGNLKSLVFVSHRRFVPEKLARFTEVIQDPGPGPDEILKIVTETCSGLHIDAPPDSESLFRGLTSFEVQSALFQSYRRSRSADVVELARYRMRQLKKTDLVQHLDVSGVSFDKVGGLGRFKAWAQRTKAAWTPEGRAFGLEPPRGVLALGVWGCGKSLSVKALGNAWGLPVIQLEMGRLRSSAVGESEANIYRAVRLIESVSPAIVFIDEAEKSLAGGHSSSQTDAGTTSRTIGILSTWLQETKAPICMAMTANSVRTLPIEFLNRMDERFFYDLPSVEDRIDILKIHLERRNQPPERFDLASLGDASENMVGREIEQCVKSAMTISFERGFPALDEEVLLDELTRKPRIVRTMQDEIRETLEWVGFDPDLDDGIRARFAADPRGQDRVITLG